MIRTMRNLLKKPVFEERKASWINELSIANKEYNNTIHSSIKLTLQQILKKSKEKEVYSNHQVGRVRQQKTN